MRLDTTPSGQAGGEAEAPAAESQKSQNPGVFEDSEVSATPKNLCDLWNLWFLPSEGPTARIA
jgi:hypothetical protein